MDDDKEQKAVTQFKIGMIGVLSPFDMYGLGIFIPGAIEEATELMLQTRKRLNGIDEPISLELAKRKLKTRRKK